MTATLFRRPGVVEGPDLHDPCRRASATGLVVVLRLISGLAGHSDRHRPATRR